MHEGDVKLDVLARCGEPAVVDSWDEVRGVSNQFVRFVRLENGRVTAVSTGTYGYAG